MHRHWHHRGGQVLQVASQRFAQGVHIKGLQVTQAPICQGRDLPWERGADLAPTPERCVPLQQECSERWGHLERARKSLAAASNHRTWQVGTLRALAAPGQSSRPED